MQTNRLNGLIDRIQPNGKSRLNKVRKMIKVVNINTEKLLLTKLGQKMLKKPMGFFDVGSLGGIHPITENFSNYLNVLCFEPNKKELENIKKKYTKNNYAKIIYSEKALFKNKGTKILYIAKLDTNSSLLRASDEFIKRYQATNFETIDQEKIKTTTIDLIIDEELRKENIKAEFIKIDTQGTEYQILEGAKDNLKSNLECCGLLIPGLVPEKDCNTEKHIKFLEFVNKLK